MALRNTGKPIQSSKGKPKMSIADDCKCSVLGASDELLQLPWLEGLDCIAVSTYFSHVVVQHDFWTWKHEHVQSVDRVVFEVFQHTLQAISCFLQLFV